jgi:hypothetical protein
LNLESSGRELEAIVVGEIQKAIGAFGAILSKEADYSEQTVDQLRNGPITMPRDLEWENFIEQDPNFISPNLPLRDVQHIEYPGKHHPSATEVRAGMLERKSKYLKSYTPGWYVQSRSQLYLLTVDRFVLSPTHLHEFKSADSVYAQSPVVSLYLADQKLGAHSQPTSSSHKFILKGKQSGGMHRGHSWVFRAESYDTMLAWYDDIKSLTETTREARKEFIRGHTRAVSSYSTRSVSSLEEDEADQIPFSRENLAMTGERQPSAPKPERPQPGGRFPSSLDYASQRSRSPHSEASEPDQEWGQEVIGYLSGTGLNPTVVSPAADHHSEIAELGHYPNKSREALDNMVHPSPSGHKAVLEDEHSTSIIPGSHSIEDHDVVQHEIVEPSHAELSHETHVEQPTATVPTSQHVTFPPRTNGHPLNASHAYENADDSVKSTVPEIVITGDEPQPVPKPLPAITRTDTDKSVSNFDMPGKYIN